MTSGCSRFLASPSQAEDRHEIVLAQCPACGLVQLRTAVPAAALIPRYAWLTYREPEGHLDAVADVVASLPGLGRDARACGASYKDDSTVQRLCARGFAASWRIDPAADLGVADPRAGVETVQDRLRPVLAGGLAARRGRPHVVVARHILEHADDVTAFLGALLQLVHPDGYFVLEVPDCRRTLDMCDYTTVWEEHVLYFTPDTFRACVEAAGLELVRFDCYPYPYENSLVAIARPRGEPRPARLPAEVLGRERERAEAFGRAFPERRRAVQRFLADYCARRGGVALLGGGHLACAFINLMEVRAHLRFVADDDPNKQGLFMPGSRLPIRGSSTLAEGGITLCLTSVNPQSEDAVLQRHRAFVGHGGTFASIFPSSPSALWARVDGGRA